MSKNQINSENLNDKINLPSDFDAKEYLSLNADLNELSDEKAKLHYLAFGKTENRFYKIPLPNDFNTTEYLLLNEDLTGLSEIDAKLHYVTIGCSENRLYKIPLPFDFNAEEYILLNSDLKEFNETEVKMHYHIHGKLENRIYKIPLPHDFKVEEYVQLNSDLSKLSNNDAILHYHTYGKSENREYSLKKVALIFHVGNIEIFEDICNTYKIFFSRKNLLIFITTHTEDNCKKIKSIFPDSHVEIIENKGMDIGGFLKSIEMIFNHELYPTIDCFYKIHTKTNEYWRNGLLRPLLHNFSNIEKNFINKSIPIIIGSDVYVHGNNKPVNINYIIDIIDRNKETFPFTREEIIKKYDEYYFSESDEKNIYTYLDLNSDFYKFYEEDLKNYSTDDATAHFEKYGKNEFHRISNPCYIKKFSEKTYFVAGTIFAFNKSYMKIFEKINIKKEISILEEGYIINNIPRKTHAWEYFFGKISYLFNGYMECIDSAGTIARKTDDKNIDINMYRKINHDVEKLSDDKVIQHYNEFGKSEKRAACLEHLKKPQAILSNTIFKSNIAFFMLVPVDSFSGGYRTLLNYINYLVKNGMYVDVYFGQETKSMDLFQGLSNIKFNLDEILDVIKTYNVIEDYDKINFFIGLNVQKDYDFIVANAWQISEAVYLNRSKSRKLIYIIQDEEALFYPNNEILQNKVIDTYKKEFDYYCLGKFMTKKFKMIFPYSKIIPSTLGANLNSYFNMNLGRENSIVIAYYKGKVGRKPELIERIIELLCDHFKLYIFPDSYTKKTSCNIINIGVKKIEELNILYNTCKLGFVMSDTNPSRLGFEMIASGLKVFEYDSKFTRIDLPDDYFFKIDESFLNKMFVEIVQNNLNQPYVYPEEYVKSISTENELKSLLSVFIEE